MNKEASFKSHTYYSSITGLDFNPKKIITDLGKLVHKKGDVISVKKCFFGKSETKYAETDLYDASYHDWDGTRYKRTVSPKTFTVNHGYSYDSEKNEVYKPAIVSIYFSGGKSENYKFNNDEDALKYVEDIRNKCKKCNNELL